MARPTKKSALVVRIQGLDSKAGKKAAGRNVVGVIRKSSADPNPSPVADAEFFAEADFSSNSRRGGYHGRSVPGA